MISSPPCPLCPAGNSGQALNGCRLGPGRDSTGGQPGPFFRLRVGKIRVVFEEKTVAGERVLVCFFADYRATVYRTLSQLIANDLLGELLN